jgi:hypothetical protein
MCRWLPAGSGGADWKAYMKAHPRKVQKRVRKGIPDQLRGLVWQLLSGGRDLALRNEGVCIDRLQASSRRVDWNVC